MTTEGAVAIFSDEVKKEGKGEVMKVSYRGFTAEEWADRFDEQRQTLCAIQETLDGVNEELRLAKLQGSELRVALMAMVDEVSDQTRFNEAREFAKTLLTKAGKPKDDCSCALKSHPIREDGSCSNCGGIRMDAQKRNHEQ